jgi:hypothetical protein
MYKKAKISLGPSIVRIFVLGDQAKFSCIIFWPPCFLNWKIPYPYTHLIKTNKLLHFQTSNKQETKPHTQQSLSLNKIKTSNTLQCRRFEPLNQNLVVLVATERTSLIIFMHARESVVFQKMEVAYLTMLTMC